MLNGEHFLQHKCVYFYTSYLRTKYTVCPEIKDTEMLLVISST